MFHFTIKIHVHDNGWLANPSLILISGVREGNVVNTSRSCHFVENGIKRMMYRNAQVNQPV